MPSAFVTLNLTSSNFVVKGVVTLANVTGGDQSGTTLTLAQSGSASRSVTTGPLGAYTFNDLCGGSYDLAASRIGYLPATTTVVATAAVTTVPPLSLQPATFSVAGTVTVTGGGDASGVVVTLDGTTLTATTGADGTFRLDAVPGGVYTLRAAKSGLLAVAVPRLEVGAPVSGLALFMGPPPAVVKQKAGCAQAGVSGDLAGIGLALLLVAAACVLRRRRNG